MECEDQPISVSKHAFMYFGAISWHSQQLMIVEDMQYLMLRKRTLKDEHIFGDVFYLSESLQTVTVSSTPTKVFMHVGEFRDTLLPNPD